MTSVASPQHAPHSLFTAADDCLLIGGRPVTALAEQIGRTPFYAYDRALIGKRIAELRAALPRNVSLHYAIKANPMPEVVQHIAGLVDGLDVASGGEMQLAVGTGMAAARISFAGPGKSEAELEAALRAGIVINLESSREMRLLDQLARRARLKPRVAIRVNPDFELKTSGMKMSGGPKPFGIDAEQVPAVLAELAGLELEFVGFHIFCGAQNLQSEAICEAQRESVALAIRLAAHAPSPVRKLNIGGGFGIPYFPGERPLDLAPISRNLASLASRIGEELPHAEPIIELGRYIVGEAGIYVCRVIDRKLSRGQLFLVTDGGLHQHLAASGNFGQVIRKNYPVVVGNRLTARDAELASVVGPLCTPLDLLADRMPLGHAQVGDLIVVLQSGAYGLTASPLGFLGHPPPAEVLV